MSMLAGFAFYIGMGWLVWLVFFYESPEKKVARLKESLKSNIYDRSGLFFLDAKSSGQLAKARVVAVIHSKDICCVFTNKYSRNEVVYGAEYSCVQMPFKELDNYFKKYWRGYCCPTSCRQKLKTFLTKLEEDEKKIREQQASSNQKIATAVQTKQIMGYVYCFSNPAMPGLLKIGYTKHHPRKRAEQLYKDGGTGVPAPFKLEFFCYCHTPDVMERRIHHALSDVRYSYSREFFRLSTAEAKQVFGRQLPSGCKIELA